MRLRGVFSLCAVAALLSGPALTPSSARCDQDEARQAVEQGRIRPLAEILRMVRGKLPGEVVHTKLENKGTFWLYEFRVINGSGQMFDVHVDGQSGAILAVREK
ncbi:MAG: peptidase [Alphaproteobacteria bacterium]|nr:peptidase [Alphaproteobacteria bacterium]